MKIIIYAPGLNLSPDINEYLKKKINKLDKFIPRRHKQEGGFSEIVARIKIEQETTKGVCLYKVGAEIILPHQVVVASSQNQNILRAINELKAKLRVEIKKYSGKKEAVYKRTVRLTKRMRLWAGERLPKGKRERHE